MGGQVNALQNLVLFHELSLKEETISLLCSFMIECFYGNNGGTKE